MAKKSWGQIKTSSCLSEHLSDWYLNLKPIHLFEFDERSALFNINSNLRLATPTHKYHLCLTNKALKGQSDCTSSSMYVYVPLIFNDKLHVE